MPRHWLPPELQGRFLSLWASQRTFLLWSISSTVWYGTVSYGIIDTPYSNRVREKARPYEDAALVPLSGPKCMQVGMSRNWSVDHDQMILSSRVVVVVVVVVIGEEWFVRSTENREVMLHRVRSTPYIKRVITYWHHGLVPWKDRRIGGAEGGVWLLVCIPYLQANLQCSL